MHTFWSRANSVLTFFGTTAAVLCVLVSLTELFHHADPPASLRLVEVKRLAEHRGRQDQAVLSLSLNADLSSCFNWNTKQLFVYVQAEYETPDNKLNQVVLWDKIVQSPGEAVLQAQGLRQKYPLLDLGHNLRGRPFNLTLAWNVMPRVGWLYVVSKSFPQQPLPDEYTD